MTRLLDNFLNTCNDPMYCFQTKHELNTFKLFFKANTKNIIEKNQVTILS